MVFKIPSDYMIPDGLNFTFTEHCFGNHWMLRWNGNEWEGDNIKGKINGKIINKCNLPADYSADHQLHTSHIMIKKEFNEKFIKKRADNSNLMYCMIQNSVDKTDDRERPKIYVKYKDGTVFRAQDQSIGRFISMTYRASNEYSVEGYDLLIIGFKLEFYQNSVIDPAKIDLLYLDIPTENYPECINRFTFSIEKYNELTSETIGVWLVTNGVLDTLEKLNIEWSTSNITNSKDIELYLSKAFTDPIDEVNWDSKTNAFKYIIDQQFYEITPNPNAATTLYTDFNITSSKIITADNITTMRSDLNIVSNNVDIMSYDIKDTMQKVEFLNSDMAVQKLKTQYLECELDKVRITAEAGLVIGSISLGLQLTAGGLNFLGELPGILSGLSSRIVCGGYEPLVEAAAMAGSFITYSLRTDLTPLFEWCDKVYEPFEFENEIDKRIAETSTPTLEGVLDLCNRFMNAIKPTFKLIATRINEMESDIETALTNYVNKNDLKREDKIDIVCSKTQNLINLKAEDIITDGVITVKIFVGGLIKPYVFSITFENGLITEFKGTDEYSEKNGKIDFKDPVLKDKIIMIERTNDTVDIAGTTILTNTCCRRMTYNINDLAYIQDIEALDEKITALAEISHLNDVSIMSIQEEYATVNEVNEVLANNYVLKSELPPVADLSEYRKKDDLLSYTNTSCLTEATFEKAGNWYRLDLNYIEGTRFEIKYEDTTYSFLFTIDEQTKQGNNDVYDYNIADGLRFRWIPRSSSLSLLWLLNSSDIILKYELLSVIYPAPDEFALKSQIEELKKENAELRAQIALQPNYPWLSYYSEFTERLEFIDGDYVAKYIAYTYTEASKQLYFVITYRAYEMHKDFVFVLIDDAFETHYFRCDMVNKVVHYNEIKNSTLASLPNAFSLNIPDGITFNTNDANQTHAFTYIFTTPG